MNPELDHLRQLFDDVHTVAIEAINALRPRQRESIAVNDAVLIDATQRLREITAEIIGIQISRLIEHS